jgi:hypothetical protein
MTSKKLKLHLMNDIKSYMLGGKDEGMPQLLFNKLDDV